MATLGDIAVSGALNLLGAFIFLLAFAILRIQPFNDRVYFPKWYLKGLRSSASHSGAFVRRIVNLDFRSYTRFLNWMPEALKMPEPELVDHAGLDSAVYLRIYLMGLKIFVPIAFLAWAILVPVNYTNDTLETAQQVSNVTASDIDKLSISNVPLKSQRFWAHIVMAYAFTFWTCYVLLKEYEKVASMRLQFLSSEGRRPDQFTVLVRNVPPDPDESVSELVEHFFLVNHPHHYLIHQVVCNANKLASLVKKKKSKQNWLDYYQLKYDRNPSQKPLKKTGFLGLWGEKVDAIDHHKSEIKKLSEEIEEERKKVLKDPKSIMPAAFVSFKTRWGAAVCAQTQQSRNPTLWLTEWAPEPRDVYWENLAIPYMSLSVRRLIIGVAFFFLTFFFMIPIASVQALASIEGIEKKAPFLKPIIEIKFIKSVIQGFLPGIALKLFLIFLPTILMIMSKFEGFLSISSLERRSATRYYIFLIINVFLGSILAGAAFEQLNSFINQSANEIPKTIGVAVPLKATFFITYIMVDGWAGIAGEVLMLKPLILYHLKNFFLVKTEKDREEAMDPGSLGFNTGEPRIQLYFLLGLVYATVTPVLLPFIIIFFAFAYVVFRHQIINVYNQEYESGAAFWPDVHGRVITALVISQLALLGLMSTKEAVIASADILKQIFKIPYSKARLSIAVRRIGQTLVLNKGPDAEEGERLVRRHKNQSKKCTDQSLFLNFAMHSVRMEACDCPPIHPASSKGQSNSSVLPGGDASQFVGQSDDVTRNEGFNHCSEYPHVKQDNFFWESKKNKRTKGHHPVKKSSHLGEKPRSSMQETEKHKRVSNDGFLRVLFWQFHNFRMLLGSDLLLFSNEKYVAVSLHLWDVTRQVTPLTWLEAWLDNVMASVPELAICYHQDGVVQGYELLKTDDIFLLKGISEDGTPAFHPHVVQQNGLSVLRFLEENCKQDPGAYWLYKSAGEDMIQLFDLCVIPKTHSSNDCDDGTSSLPSLLHRGRSDSLFSLGTLLYRIAHRLSLSMAPNNRAKCARFFQQCLEFLDDPDHLVVRASAHEQFARLLLNHDEELELTFESLPGECEVTVPVDSSDPLSRFSESVAYENVSSVAEDRWSEEGKAFREVISEASVKLTLESNISTPGNLIALDDTESKDSGVLPSSSSDEMVAVCKVSPTPPHAVQTVAEPVSSKLAAVHHVSQAIKSLRWMHQLQSSDSELLDEGSYFDGPPSSMNFSVCACGDADCIEVCDIRQWLPTSKVDEKLWKLVLLLGESYLALGQAYKEDKQLHQALKVVELACAVYGSMPQFLEDSRFISSMVTYSSSIKCNDGDEKMISCVSNRKEVKSSSNDRFLAYEQFSSTYLFWAKAWTLVGDVYVEFHFMKGKVLSNQSETKSSARELRISTEVVKEVQRLKKKLGQHNQNCSSCSLVNCSCQSDRASSGSSASSSSGDKHSVAYGRKHSKRSHAKGATYSLMGDSDDGRAHHKEKSRKNSGEYPQLGRGDNDTAIEASGIAVDKHEINSLADANSDVLEGGLETHDAGSILPSQSENTSKEKPKPIKGGIFKYISNPAVRDAEYNLSAALSCYQEARKALSGLPTGSAELQSVIKKIGWVCNEMGRNRLEGKELNKAELAFADAIDAFREVSDHANIILINCNLGHGRRALAEEMVSKMENLKSHPIFENAYKEALQTAKLEYSESLRYYGAARAELNAIVEEDDSVPTVLRNEVQTQFAHTYLRLGMLLAKEDVTTRVYENGALEDMPVVTISPNEKRDRKEVRKHEISANDAIREALTVYESLGQLRKQEAAYAYSQLASYQRDCCLKFLNLDLKNTTLNKNGNNNLQRVKQYACLAERNWQKAMDFYSPKTHPAMHLTILIERSALSLSLSSTLHSNVMLESALARMLEGRHISDDSFGTDYPEINSKFWGQLQMLLKKMLSLALSANANKPAAFAQAIPSSSKCGDAGKLRELYKMSLKSSNLSQLHAMHTLWTS